MKYKKNETDFTIPNKVNTIKDITILKKVNTEKKNTHKILPCRVKLNFKIERNKMNQTKINILIRGKD